MYKKNKIDVITLGCSKNLVDSEQLMYQFQENGYKIEHNSHHINGEIVVVNTCGFIGDAQEESINMILELAKAKKENRIGKLFVMGCLSERFLKDLQQEIPDVDKYYGKFDWNQLICDLGKAYKTVASEHRVLTTPSHYAYLKIAEGCDRTCSYCAIPITTGKYKSRSIEDIVKEVEWLQLKGVKEFQLIAQDLTYYGYDLYKQAKLPELVERISDIKGVEWIRLHYGYPNLFPKDLLRVMRERDNVCKYMDIAFQHISNNMLKIMRRNITKNEIYDLINAMRQEVPGINIRTTLMVGHPGETEDDFNELIDFVKDVRFERMGAFAYSHEIGTYSYNHYKDDIDDDIKQERMNKLMEIQERISYQVNCDRIGKTFKTIIDSEDDDFYVGRTEFDSPEVDPELLISKDKPLKIGEFYQVEVEDAQPYDLYGSVKS